MNMVTATIDETRSAPGAGFPGEPLRVCFLFDLLQPGGTETQLVKLIGGLDRRRVLPHLCLLDGQSELSRSMEPDDCPVIRLGACALHRPATWRGAWRLSRQLRAWQIDVLQLFFPDSTYVGAVAGRLANVKAVVRTRRNLYHWVTPVQKRCGPLIDGFYSRYLVDALVANSEACKRAVQAQERPVPRILEVIPNGLDLGSFAAHQGPPPLSAPTTVVGAVAMFRKEKNVQLLVEAAGLVLKDHPLVVFRLAGDGPLRAEIETLAARLGSAERLELAGRIVNVAEFLAGVDIAVLPSASEGSPNAIIEYMAAGRAIVATDVGGCPELIEHEVDGLLVPSGDAAAMAAAICRLINEPELARRLAANAAVKAPAYSIESTVRRHEDFYRRLVANLEMRRRPISASSAVTEVR